MRGKESETVVRAEAGGGQVGAIYSNEYNVVLFLHHLQNVTTL